MKWPWRRQGQPQRAAVEGATARAAEHAVQGRAEEPASAVAAVAQRVTQRRFVAVLASAAAAAGAGLLTAAPHAAEAAYVAGGATDGGDLVNTHLTVQGNVTGKANLWVYDGTANLNLRAADNNIYLDAANAQVFRVNMVNVLPNWGNVALYLAASRNVGMGTLFPAERLDVVGNIRYSGALIANGVTAVDTNGVATKAYYAP